MSIFKRVGFACKYIASNQNQSKKSLKETQQKDVLNFLEKKFFMAGELARQLDVRLSMHPGQFVVLTSTTHEVVERSMLEFEYHANLIRWIGYGKTFEVATGSLGQTEVN